MSTWKVFVIMAFGCVCLGLGLATVVVPLAVDENRWLWLAGLLFATVGTSASFAVYLNKMDRTF
jgi:hypothetical protein